MELKKLILDSKMDIESENIIFDAPMKKYTTFKIGGPAEVLIKVKSEKELKEVINFADANSVDVTIIGNGSNILVTDKGIKGIVVLNRIEKIEINKNDNSNVEIVTGSGTKMGKLANVLLRDEIEGFEEL